MGWQYRHRESCKDIFLGGKEAVADAALQGLSAQEMAVIQDLLQCQSVTSQVLSSKHKKINVEEFEHCCQETTAVLVMHLPLP